MGAKDLNEHVCGFSMKMIEKLQTKNFKRHFLQFSSHTFCKQGYKLQVIPMNSVTINNGGSCV